MKAITVRLDEGLLGAVDRTRGAVARERWIRDLLYREVGLVSADSIALERVSAERVASQAVDVSRLEPPVTPPPPPVESKIDRAMSRREAWRVAQKGGPK